jgi:heme oxygenase
MAHRIDTTRHEQKHLFHQPLHGERRTRRRLPVFTGDLANTTARAAPLLVALKRTARPDLARLNAYNRLGSRSGDPDYRTFVDLHHRWLAGLDRALADAAAPYGLPVSGPRLDAGAAEPAPVAPVTSRAQGLAYLYVFEAFRLGCRVLLRQLRAIGVDAGGGATVAEVGAGAARAWLELSEALRRAAADEYAAVLEAARALFAEWERVTGGA